MPRGIYNRKTKVVPNLPIAPELKEGVIPDPSKVITENDVKSVLAVCKECGHGRDMHYEGKADHCNTQGCLCGAWRG